MEKNLPTEYSVQKLENLSADKSVSPPVLRRSIIGKASDGKYYDVGVGSADFDGSQITVGTSETEITFTGITKSIYIESDCENSGFIYIGKIGVTTTTAMAKLEPGASLTIELDDGDNPVFVISDTASQTVRKLALL